MKSIVYLPPMQKGHFVAFVQGDQAKRITVRDIEAQKVLLDHWVAQGEDKFNPAVHFQTGPAAPGQVGYRVEVEIETSKTSQPGPWEPSRDSLFAGGREPWSYCTVGCEDSGDADWNDAGVTFAFSGRLFNPMFTLASWVGEGLGHVLKAKSP